MNPGRVINCFNRRVMAKAILRILAETAMLAMKTQCARCSLQDSTIILLDTALEEQTHDLLDAMPLLARRIRALESSIFIDYAALTTYARTVIPQPKRTPMRDPLRQLLQDHQNVASVINYSRLVAEDLEDSATLCLLDGRLFAHRSAASRLDEFEFGQRKEPSLLKVALSPDCAEARNSGFN